jgi:hypothetical protein
MKSKNVLQALSKPLVLLRFFIFDYFIFFSGTTWKSMSFDEKLVSINNYF